MDALFSLARSQEEKQFLDALCGWLQSFLEDILTGHPPARWQSTTLDVLESRRREGVFAEKWQSRIRDDRINKLMDLGELTSSGYQPDTESDLKQLLEAHFNPIGFDIARTLGYKGRWLQPGIRSVILASLLLAELRHFNISSGRILLFSKRELGAAGLSVEDLRSSGMNEKKRKLVWKRTVFIRQLLADAVYMAADLKRKPRRAFKSWWFTQLEYTKSIERQKYDIWTNPVIISRVGKMQIGFQSRFGRTTFR